MPRPAAPKRTYRKAYKRTYRRKATKRSYPKSYYRKTTTVTDVEPGKQYHGTSGSNYGRRSVMKQQLSMSHPTIKHQIVETIPIGAPNRNHWRAMMKAPAHIKSLLDTHPELGRYQQCRIPDFQVGDSVLMQAVSKTSIKMPGAASAQFMVLPSIESMAHSLTGNIFENGTTNYTYNRSYKDIWNAGAQARCVSFCVNVRSTESMTNTSGRIGMVNLPSDPYDNLSITTIDDLANQPSALVVLGKDGCHMAWAPDSNVTFFAFSGPTASPASLSGQGSTSRVVPTGWKYNEFWPNGYTIAGGKATSHPLAPTTPATPLTYPMQPMFWYLGANGVSVCQDGTTNFTTKGVLLGYMVPCLLVVIDGAPTTGTYTLDVYSHWEIVPDTRGKLSEPGATGQPPSSGQGMLNKAEHVVKDVIHDVVRVGEGAVHDVEKAMGWGGSIIKYAGEAAGLAAMIL